MSENTENTEVKEQYTLSTLSPASRSTSNRIRVGRGSGSKGKTAGKGHKGQKARSGGGVQPWFESGNLPLYRKLPKRGFRSRKQIFGKNQFNVINLATLELHFKDGEDVNLETLYAVGYGTNVSKKAGVKILGYGEVTKKLNLKVNAISESAKAKIEAAGGTVELV